MGNDLGSRYSATNVPLGHADGPQPSLLNELYRSILWNTGTLNSTNFSYGSTTFLSDTGDAVSLLRDWLATTADGKSLWVSGDGSARFLNNTGARLTFLNTVLGATYVGAGYRDKSTTWGVTLTGLGPDCTTGLSYGLRANWCPQRRAYNYLAAYAGSGLYGTARTNWKYPDAGGIWNAGLQQNATAGGYNFRTELDAWSLDQLRQPGVTPTNEQNAAIDDWAARALSSCVVSCLGDLTLTGAGGVAPLSAVLQLQTVAHRHDAPLTVRYTLAAAGLVSARLYYASGRLERTLDSGLRAAGVHDVVWSPRELRAGVYFYDIALGAAHYRAKLLVLP